MWWRIIDLYSRAKLALERRIGKSLTFPSEIGSASGPMKHLTAKNVTLTAAALLSSFALSAEAASVGLSTARQTHGSNHATNPIHHLLFPADTYMIDDGTSEDAIGLSAGGDTIALNEFAVIPGSETITSVDIAWGTPVFFDPSLDGLPYTVAIWSDPNGDGDPDDAVAHNCQWCRC